MHKPVSKSSMANPQPRSLSPRAKARAQEASRVVVEVPRRESVLRVRPWTSWCYRSPAECAEGIRSHAATALTQSATSMPKVPISSATSATKATPSVATAATMVAIAVAPYSTA